MGLDYRSFANVKANIMILKRLVDGVYVEPLKATGVSNRKTAHTVSIDQVQPANTRLGIAWFARRQSKTKYKKATLYPPLTVPTTGHSEKHSIRVRDPQR